MNTQVMYTDRSRDLQPEMADISRLWRGDSDHDVQVLLQLSEKTIGPDLDFAATGILIPGS